MKLTAFVADLGMAYARLQMCFGQINASHRLLDVTCLMMTHGPAAVDMDGYADDWLLGISEEEGGWYLLFVVPGTDEQDDSFFSLPLPQDSFIANLPDVFEMHNNVLHDTIGGGNAEWLQVAGPVLAHTLPRRPRLMIYDNCVKMDETGVHNPRSFIRTKTLVASTLGDD